MASLIPPGVLVVAACWLVQQLPQLPSRALTIAMLLAIGLQESRFTYRVQINGPAHGFWQFERGGGVAGVLGHSATRGKIQHVLDQMQYSPSSNVVYQALPHNDVLACCFARLLLWTLPGPLATTSDRAWAQYIDAWRPGKPHVQTWPRLYQMARDAVPGD